MSGREVLVTGGSGFFGGVLKRRLLSEGFAVTNIDLVRDEDSHAALTSVQGDIRDADLLARLFAERQFEAVFHCAAMLAHDVSDEKMLWTSNVDGTRRLAEAAIAAGVKQVHLHLQQLSVGREPRPSGDGGRDAVAGRDLRAIKAGG